MAGGRFLVAVALVASVSSVAGGAEAASLTVGDEASYRAALATLSADGSGPHTITLTADVELADAGDPVYSGSQPLTVDGDGHSLTVTADDTRALQVPSAVAVTLDELEISGGESAGDGGAVEAVGDLTVRTSHVHDNTATGAGGGVHAGGTLTIERSTLAANSAAEGGGAAATTVVVDTSTITGNAATASGGGLSAGGLTLDWSTVIDNSAPSGANLDLGSLGGEASVVAGPQGGGTNCVEPVENATNEVVVSDESCLLDPWFDEVLAEEPEFAALADNGGPTPTRYPEPGNPVIRAHPCSEAFGFPIPPPPPPLPPDQRGRPRALVWTNFGFDSYAYYCDLGAVEADEAELDIVVDPATITIVEDRTLQQDLTITNEGPVEVLDLVVLWTTCSFDGPTSLAIGQSVTATCQQNVGDAGRVRSIGGEIGATTPWTAGHPLLPEIPIRRYTRFGTVARVICDSNFYSDVGRWLDEAVTWFTCDAGLSRGPQGGGPFHPGLRLSRLDFARLLHQAAGRPEPPPDGPGYPTTDVHPANRGLVRWATHDPDGDGPLVAPMTGFAGERFRPQRPLTRAEAVNAVWRWVGRPEGFAHDFVDVPAWVDVAVGWAGTEHEAAAPQTPVVTGFPGRTFRPRVTVTRGEAVRMLFRADRWLDTA